MPSLEQLRDYQARHLISVRTKDDLLIANYTARAMYDRVWDEVTRICRGLVLRVDVPWPDCARIEEVVALPFEKFFNVGETEEEIRAPIVEVTEKVDGCLRTDTALNLWDGGTIAIGEIVRQKLRPTLVGLDEHGRVVPTEIVAHFDNGTKSDWIEVHVDCPVSGKSGARTGNHIRATADHRFFVNGAWKRADRIAPGDIVTTYELTPSWEAFHFFQAALLGDGCINSNGQTAYFVESHKAEHQSYVDYMRRYLGPCYVIRRNRTSGYGTTMIPVTTRNYRSLVRLRRDWYPDGKKRVPDNLEWIDDFAVAKWYMDGGSFNHDPSQEDRANFATNGFPLSDIQRLGDRLSQLFGVKTTPVGGRSKGFGLRVNAGRKGEIKEFWGRISPYIVPCMRYKLPESYRSLPFTGWPHPEGIREEIVPRAATVITTNLLPVSEINFPSGHRGFDIQTTTGNYFAKGVLVHNCLGILYRHAGGFGVATRGSFAGPQARWATEFVRRFDLGGLPENLTLLFEIIYLGSRIVVDYGGREDLVLLGVRDRFTGEDWFVERVAELGAAFGLTTVRPVATIDDLAEMLTASARLGPSQEGWVVRCADGRRWKVKGDAYRQLHRLLSHVSERAVLDAIAGGTIDELLGAVPDYYRATVQGWRERVERKATEKLDKLATIFDEAPKATRKDFALWVTRRHGADAPYLFLMWEGKDPRPLLFRNLRETLASDPLVEPDEGGG